MKVLPVGIYWSLVAHYQLVTLFQSTPVGLLLGRGRTESESWRSLQWLQDVFRSLTCTKVECCLAGSKVMEPQLFSDGLAECRTAWKDGVPFFAVVVDLVWITAVVFGWVDSLVGGLGGGVYFSVRSEKATPKEMTECGRMFDLGWTLYKPKETKDPENNYCCWKHAGRPNRRFNQSLSRSLSTVLLHLVLSHVLVYELKQPPYKVHTCQKEANLSQLLNCHWSFFFFTCS